MRLYLAGAAEHTERGPAGGPVFSEHSINYLHQKRVLTINKTQKPVQKPNTKKRKKNSGKNLSRRVA